MIINVQKEDKIQTARGLGDLYSKIPYFLNQYSEDKLKIDVEKIKYKVIQGYILLEEEDWIEVKKNIEEAQVYIEDLKDVSEQENRYKYNVKKLEVLLKELEGTVDLKTKDVFYIRYVNIMQELQEL